MSDNPVRAELERLLANDYRNLNVPALVRALMACLECVDDLECEVNPWYPENMRWHFSMKRRYARDVKPVLAARAALAEIGRKQ